jgi:ABC-type Zn2+ transport system substrate-binding protein/surface adhesin
MRIRVILLVLSLFSTIGAQERPFPGARHDEVHDPDIKLPNGKSQREEMLKSEHEQSLQDAAQMVKLSEELKADLEKDTRYVVSIQTIKKTEEIEKLAKKIRGRLKRN